MHGAGKVNFYLPTKMHAYFDDDGGGSGEIHCGIIYQQKGFRFNCTHCRKLLPSLFLFAVIFDRTEVVTATP